MAGSDIEKHHHLDDFAKLFRHSETGRQVLVIQSYDTENDMCGIESKVSCDGYQVGFYFTFEDQQSCDEAFNEVGQETADRIHDQVLQLAEDGELNPDDKDEESGDESN